MNMQWMVENMWLILFFAWGMPLGIFRSKFRRMVYETDHWSINIKPYLIKEAKALLGFVHVEHPEFTKTRNSYAAYLIVYTLLFITYRIWG